MYRDLKVALLNDSFPPLIDGVANAVVNYAKVIQGNYGSSIVATPKYPDTSDDDFPFPVIRYRSLDTGKTVGYRAGYPFSASAINELKEYGPDIIHTHCPMMSTLLARTLREVIDVPIVFTYHTKFDIEIKKAIATGFLQSKAIKLMINNIEACDEVWVVSEGAADNLRSMGYRGECRVMENGVDFPRGRVSDEKVLKIKKTHEIPENIPVFLFVGRMMWYKGIKIIIDGLKKAKSSGAKFKMLFVGGGGEVDEIMDYSKKTGMSEDCIFVGAVRDRELLRAYFCASDLFLFPSTFDTNGIVVREAAACSLPSMLIKDSCASEGISHMRNGILIEENAYALYDKVMYACNNMDEIAEIGRLASEEIYMSWEKAVEKAVDRYGTVLRNYQGGHQYYRATIGDEFFAATSDIISGINKMRSFRIFK